MFIVKLYLIVCFSLFAFSFIYYSNVTQKHYKKMEQIEEEKAVEADESDSIS